AAVTGRKLIADQSRSSLIVRWPPIILLIAPGKMISHIVTVCSIVFVKGATISISLAGHLFVAFLAISLSLAGSKASEAQTNHWSLQPLRKPAIPGVSNRAWPKTPIDHFILAKLEATGLKPA